MNDVFTWAKDAARLEANAQGSNRREYLMMAAGIRRRIVAEAVKLEARLKVERQSGLAAMAQVPALAGALDQVEDLIAAVRYGTRESRFAAVERLTGEAVTLVPVPVVVRLLPETERSVSPADIDRVNSYR